MNGNELYVVKEYKFYNPITTEIDSMIEKCFRDSHKIYFHNFKYESIYDIKLTNITNNEMIKLTISGKILRLFELTKKFNVARQIGFMFNRINKLTIKFYSHLRYINIGYYLMFQTPICHRHFFRKLSQNKEYVKNFCNDMENPFHFACQK